MKAILRRSGRIPLLIAIVGGWLWVCLAFPDQVWAFVRLIGTIFLWLLAAMLVLGSVVSSISGPPLPPANQLGTLPSQAPPPPRPRDTLTPFLFGLTLGWRLGNDDSTDC